ncbi:MAG: transposase, partial [Candidatus Ozemobacteraceae bacterium]
INLRNEWKGFLWQGRFFSCALDESHTLAAARYIEQNPVRAGLVKDPAEYPWSSANAHCTGKDDALVSVRPLLEMVGDWKEFLLGKVSTEERDQLQRHEQTGRPLGNEAFITRLERRMDRCLRPGTPGPKGPQEKKKF